MTIGDWILNKSIESTSYRLNKLTEIEAPRILLESLSVTLAEMRNGIIKVSDPNNKLDMDFINSEQRVGSGGKIYYSINDGKAFYFPQAQYGRFLK